MGKAEGEYEWEVDFSGSTIVWARTAAEARALARDGLMGGEDLEITSVKRLDE